MYDSFITKRELSSLNFLSGWIGCVSCVLESLVQLYEVAANGSAQCIRETKLDWAQIHGPTIFKIILHLLKK